MLALAPFAKRKRYSLKHIYMASMDYSPAHPFNPKETPTTAQIPPDL